MSLIDDKELRLRFTYHRPSDCQVEKMARTRTMSRDLATLIAMSCPDCRELGLALTHLEQASMFANASIVRREP